MKPTRRHSLHCMRNKLFIAAFAFISLTAHAEGEKFQVTLMLSPSAEWLHFRNSLYAATYNAQWGTKLSYNFGLEYKRFFDPSLSFSTGLLYMNKGFRNDIQASTYGNSSAGQDALGVTLGSVHMIAVPLYLNAHHRLARKVEMIYTAGFAGGYIFSETVRNRYYTEEEIPEQGFLDLSSGKSNVNLFKDYYAGLHFGAGISAYLKSRIVLIVQPMFKLQLNNARDYGGAFSSSDPFSAKLNSFGIDLKVGYFFTKQIRNRRKEL